MDFCVHGEFARGHLLYIVTNNPVGIMNMHLMTRYSALDQFVDKPF